MASRSGPCKALGPVRALTLLALLAFAGCGSNDPTDFHTSSRTESGGSGAAAQGGSAGTEPGGAGGAPMAGAAGAPLGGASGAAPGGAGAGGTPSGGAAGVAGVGLGGTGGSGGMPPAGGGPNGGTGPRGGTGGSQTITFSCGSLTCVADRQYCVRTLPEGSGGPEMRMCLPFADSCATLNCDCFCKPPMNSPCGPMSTCTCMADGSRINVTCSG
jgi:hypothetical protein